MTPRENGFELLFCRPEIPTSSSSEAALATCEGNQQRAYRLLNLKNRDLLYRLVKKHGIEPKRFQR